MHKEAHIFQISELTFIEKVLNEWYFRRKREKSQLEELVKKYDDNNDGVLQFAEFEALVT